MNISAARVGRWLSYLPTRLAGKRKGKRHRGRRAQRWEEIRRLRFEFLERRDLLSVTAFDDPTSFSDPHYLTDEDATLNIAAEYGVLANDSGLNIAVSGFDAQSQLGAGVTVNTNGSVTYDPTHSA